MKITVLEFCSFVEAHQTTRLYNSEGSYHRQKLQTQRKYFVFAYFQSMNILSSIHCFLMYI
jgi:hypothetical protein